MENKNNVIGIVAISVIFVLFVIVILIGLFSTDKPTAPNPSQIEKLRDEAINGNVDSAQKLAEFTGNKEACEAMLQVVQQATDEDPKIKCLVGLGMNKYFDAGEVLIKIMEKDDQEIVLRHQAYLATTKFMSDYFYNARAPLDERREICKQMMGEWKGRKLTKEAKGGGGG